MLVLRVDVVDVFVLKVDVIDVFVLRVDVIDVLELRVDVVDVDEFRVAHVVGKSTVFLKLSAIWLDPLPTETSNLTLVLAS